MDITSEMNIKGINITSERKVQGMDITCERNVQGTGFVYKCTYKGLTVYVDSCLSKL